MHTMLNMYCICLALKTEACAEGLPFMQCHLRHGKISTTFTHSTGHR